EPDVHHPGARRALHRSRRAHPLHLELAPEAAPAARCEGGRGGDRVSVWVQRLENPLSARLRDPAATGYTGILLGALAAFLCIPPVQARTVTWPIVVGVIAAVFGIWTVTRGRARLGWGAVAAGVIGIGLGILATRSSVGNLNGVVNIGLEGMMLMGAFWGVYGADKGGSWVVGLLVGGGVGALLALVYGYFAIHLRADQIVGGTAVNFLALGITGYFFFQFYNGNYIPSGVSTIPNVTIPGLRH